MHLNDDRHLQTPLEHTGTGIPCHVPTVTDVAMTLTRWRPSAWNALLSLLPRSETFTQ